MLFCSMIIVWSATGSGDPAELKLVKRVQQEYAKAGDISAKFSQTFHDKLRGERPTESGLLWAKRDGRVRWSYRKPTRKDFVYTGMAAYFYEPENAQVTIFERFEESPLASAIQFLWGQGGILEHFGVAPCTEACLPVDGGGTSVLLTPIQPLPSVHRIQLTVDKSHHVRQSLVFDPIGNRTRYQFDEIKFGQEVNPEKFEFRVPDGVSIIRATGNDG